MPAEAPSGRYVYEVYCDHAGDHVVSDHPVENLPVLIEQTCRTMPLDELADLDWFPALVNRLCEDHGFRRLRAAGAVDAEDIRDDVGSQRRRAGERGQRLKRFGRRSPKPPVIELHGLNFGPLVLTADLPALVYFFSPWCGLCWQAEPVVQALAGELRGRAVVGEVNVTDRDDLAGRYGVAAAPTFIVFRAGRPVATLVGVQTADTLRAALGVARDEDDHAIR